MSSHATATTVELLSHASSWNALVASTAAGLGAYRRFRTRVSATASGWDSEQPLRLVVQSYQRHTLGESGLPLRHARPLSSAQRAVTADQLREGLELDLIHVQKDLLEGDPCSLVVWVEPGEADLEFDGLLARPGAQARLAVSSLASGSPVVFDQQAA